jgi:hypothetical protein
MPNWCNNSVSITHLTDPAKLEALASAVREGKFCDFAIPVPEDLKITAGFLGDGEEQRKLEEATARNVEKYGFGNWYDYCVNRWGTKWDVDAYEGENVKVEDGVLSFGFDSAWAPPVGVYEALYEQGFSIKAFYWEGGMCFAGKWEDGNDDYYELSGMNSKQVAEEIDPELDEVMCISESIASYEEEEEENE